MFDNYQQRGDSPRGCPVSLMRSMTAGQSRAANVSPLLLMAAALIAVGLVAIASASTGPEVRFGNECITQFAT